MPRSSSGHRPENPREILRCTGRRVRSSETRSKRERTRRKRRRPVPLPSFVRVNRMTAWGPGNPGGIVRIRSGDPAPLRGSGQALPASGQAFGTQGKPFVFRGPPLRGPGQTLPASGQAFDAQGKPFLLQGKPSRIRVNPACFGDPPSKLRANRGRGSG
jgi:hypothetical protein